MFDQDAYEGPDDGAPDDSPATRWTLGHPFPARSQEPRAMDPNATVSRILEAMNFGEADDMQEAAEDLLSWLRGGGFPPFRLTRPAAEQLATAALAMARDIRRAFDMQAEELCN